MYQTILILPGGEEISSGAAGKNAIRQLNLTQSVNAGEELTCGSVCAAMAELKLITPGGGVNLTAGDEIRLERLCDGTRHALGRFLLSSPTRPTADTLHLTAYDFVTKLDKDLTAWLQNQSFPMTAAELAKAVCEACGAEFACGDFTNQDHPIAALSGSCTGRQLMGYIAQLAGGFCRADSEGRIRIGGYENRGRTLSAADCFRRGLIREDYTVEPVTGVCLQLGSGLWPEGGENPYIIEQNPLLAANEAGRAAMEAMQSRIPSGYTPCTLTVLADPAIEPGEILTVTDGNGQTFTTLVMEKQTKGQRSVLLCTGSQKRTAATALHPGNPRQLTQKELFDRLTGGGEAQGLYLQDGQLYINASYLASGIIDAAVVQVVNLIADKLQSRAGNSVLGIDGAEISLSMGENPTVSLHNMDYDERAMPILYMNDLDETGQVTNRLELTPHHFRLGGSEAGGPLYLQISDGEAQLALGEEDTPKTLYWYKHSDGSYSLRGK